jgi:hypothetical protein
MAIYASSHTRGTQRVDLVTLGAISAPMQSLAQDQLFVARAEPGQRRPAKGRAQPMAVHSSTSVPSGQRT